MGRRTVHGETAEAVQPRTDVGSGQAEEWPSQQRQLRLWLVHRPEEWTPLHSPRWRVAGIRDGYRPLRGRSVDRGRALESGRRETREDHATRCRNIFGGE